MKNKTLYQNIFHRGLNVERHGDIVQIQSKEEIPIDILLPSSFELEKEAMAQLIQFAHFKTPSGHGPTCACATPDFHKGSTIPVGSVVTTPHSMVIPAAIGTDINCGMRYHHTGLNIEQFLAIKQPLLHLLKGDLLGSSRDLPTTNTAMAALFQDGYDAFLRTMKRSPDGLFTSINYERAFAEIERLHPSAHVSGNVHYAPENLLKRSWMRDASLATLGGGNHFCEFQVVDRIEDRHQAYQHGLKVGDVVYMIHTGSRDVGFYIGQRWMDKAKALYPHGLKHPPSGIYALEHDMVNEYLAAMHSAAHYATANRALIAELVRHRIAEVTGSDKDRLITDVPHNIILKEKSGNVHRKGATPAYESQLLVIPGSMGAESFFLSGLGNEQWCQSASHGAGRQYRRNEIRFQGKKNYDSLGLTGIECITLKEERKIEEAPAAYKPIGDVIDSQIAHGVCQTIAVMKPLVTFKA